MIVDIILGNNIDTANWICDLRANGSENIIVVDYDYHKEFEEIEGINYMAPSEASKYIKKYDTVNYYKSMYVFPGMSGNMSSLHVLKTEN